MAKLPWDNAPRTQIVECTVEEYDRARTQYMGSHMLELFRFSPRQCQWKMQGLLASTTKAYYEFGKAFHCFLLEGPTEFHARYEISEGPINPKTQSPYGRDTKAFAEWYEEFTATGKQAVSGNEFAQIQQMVESVEETCARDLLQSGRSELTVRGQLHGVTCQSRLDFWNHDNAVLVDVKTTENLGRFEKDFAKFGYDRQLAFYRGMVAGLGSLNYLPSVYVIAVEKSEPYRSHVWKISESTLGEADEQIKASLLQYRQLVANVGWDRPWPLSLEFGRSLSEI